MAFSDLTASQHKLIRSLVEQLATGDYSPEFWALATLDRGWFIQLTGQGGAKGHVIDGFVETDLNALESEGYITLLHKKTGFVGSLKPKAYSEYKADTADVHVTGGVYKREMKVEKSGFDETHLQQIEDKSRALIDELHENYGLSRKQAASWFKWTLVVSVGGFALIAAGVVLVLADLAAVGTVSSVGGLVSEFLAAVFVKQTKDANDRQDKYHADLITRQKILDAVQVVRLLPNDSDRNRMVEMIIRQLLGIGEEGSEKEI